MNWTSCSGTLNVPTFKCIPLIISNLFNGLFFFIGLIALGMIFYAAYKYIRSRGDQASIEEAKRTLTYGVIGIIVMFSAFIIVSLIATLTGASQIAKPLGTP